MSTSAAKKVSTPLHPVFVAGAVVRENGTWEPPGGVLELSETLEDGVRREVYEETGTKASVERLAGVYKNVTRGIVAPVFRCHPEGGSEQLPDESTAVAWLTPEEISDRMGEV